LRTTTTVSASPSFSGMNQYVQFNYFSRQKIPLVALL
jgi:hypothetical protein